MDESLKARAVSFLEQDDDDDDEYETGEIVDIAKSLERTMSSGGFPTSSRKLFTSFLDLMVRLSGRDKDDFVDYLRKEHMRLSKMM